MKFQEENSNLVVKLRNKMGFKRNYKSDFSKSEERMKFFKIKFQL